MAASTHMSMRVHSPMLTMSDTAPSVRNCVPPKSRRGQSDEECAPRDSGGKRRHVAQRKSQWAGQAAILRATCGHDGSAIFRRANSTHPPPDNVPTSHRFHLRGEAVFFAKTFQHLEFAVRTALGVHPCPRQGAAFPAPSARHRAFHHADQPIAHIGRHVVVAANGHGFSSTVFDCPDRKRWSCLRTREECKSVYRERAGVTSNIANSSTGAAIKAEHARNPANAGVSS